MPRLRYTLEQIGSLVAVAQHQSVTRAAAALGLSQSAVTQQLRLLERALGVELAERSGRGVRLTPAGRAVVAAARAALEAARHLEEEARSAQAATAGTLVVGASHTPAGYYLQGALATFVEGHPEVTVHVDVGFAADICRRVAEGGLDCGVIEGLAHLPGLVEHRLTEDEIIAVARPDHPLAGLRTVSARQLARYRYLAREPGAGTEAVAREMLGDLSGVIHRLELGSLDVVRAGAVAGNGFAILPRIAVRGELARGELTRLEVPSRSRPIRAIRRRRTGPVLSAFWDVLCQAPDRTTAGAG